MVKVPRNYHVVKSPGMRGGGIGWLMVYSLWAVSLGVCITPDNTLTPGRTLKIGSCCALLRETWVHRIALFRDTWGLGLLCGRVKPPGIAASNCQDGDSIQPSTWGQHQDRDSIQPSTWGQHPTVNMGTASTWGQHATVNMGTAISAEDSLWLSVWRGDKNLNINQ